MTTPPSNPDAALRAAILKGNIVFVAGTGVSVSATYDLTKKASHPQASWTGLLRHGLETAERMCQLTKSKAALYLNLLSEDPTTQNLISTATTVTAALGGASSGIFKQWLEDTIGKIRPINRDITDALHALREAENLLATTNYDDVLLDDHPTLRPVTWMDGNEIIGAQRNREIDKVIYLHGYWQRPETVMRHVPFAGAPAFNEILAQSHLPAVWRGDTTDRHLLGELNERVREATDDCPRSRHPERRVVYHSAPEPAKPTLIQREHKRHGRATRHAL